VTKNRDGEAKRTCLTNESRRCTPALLNTLDKEQILDLLAFVLADRNADSQAVHSNNTK
jgi:hypothetical protein